MARRHVMTPRRKVALRKAQLASARKRKHVTVYHYTTQKKAAKIVAQQRFKTHSGLRAPGNKKGQVYVTRRRSKFYQNEFLAFGRKSHAVSFRVAAKHVKRDPNDEWFLKHSAVTYAKHRPANAYMIDNRHVQGRKIKAISSMPTKRKR